MSLKNESREYLRATLATKMDKILGMIGFLDQGITADNLGLNEEFVNRVIDDCYLEIFTEDEVESMVEFYKQFESRVEILNKSVEAKVSEAITKNQETVLAMFEGK